MEGPPTKLLIFYLLLMNHLVLLQFASVTEIAVQEDFAPNMTSGGTSGEEAKNLIVYVPHKL